MTFTAQAQAAKIASREVAVLNRQRKDEALIAMAEALAADEGLVLEANSLDLQRTKQAGVRLEIIDRLMLNPARITGMVQGLRDLAKLPDPVGEIVRGWTLPNGVRVRQERVPFGVVGIIYEARPNVTADATGICVKSGNAVLLRGSSSAIESNRAIVQALRRGLDKAGINPNLISLVEGGRQVSDELMSARGLVDVLIPRGGAGLIEAVVQGAKVPVIETGTGNTHLYVDRLADLDQAVQVIINAKTQRPSVCNALETLLVHTEIAAEFIPKVIAELGRRGVTVHGDAAFMRLGEGVIPADENEYDQEYLSLDLAAKVVDSITEAIAHIQIHSSGHSETIITTDRRASERFIREVDAAVILVNASSRFVDGGEFGFGAEIGISTQKLHARGPMGLTEMTSTKYILDGDGQVRQPQA